MVHNAIKAFNQSFKITPSFKQAEETEYNIKSALWQLPYNKDYLKYDEDGTRWFEYINKNGNNEIKSVEKGLNIDTSNYRVYFKTTNYDDFTYDVESKYPNRNTIIENHGKNYVYVRIKNKLNQLVADKIFNYANNEGRKNIYKTVKIDGNEFTIVKVYSYDTTKNKAVDVVNYGYTSSESSLTKGCKFENEYYMLNGKEVSNVKIDGNKYIIKTDEGRMLTFTVE